MVIDYLSKWIEAKAWTSTTEFQVIMFLKVNIILWYGIPKVLRSYNRPQFVRKEVRCLCEEYKIDHRSSSVQHPQINGQAEANNKVILVDLKKRGQALKEN